DRGPPAFSTFVLSSLESEPSKRSSLTRRGHAERSHQDWEGRHEGQSSVPGARVPLWKSQVSEATVGRKGPSKSRQRRVRPAVFPSPTRRFRLLGICAFWRTGERLAIMSSTARLIPSLRSCSRGVRLLRSVPSGSLRTPRTALGGRPIWAYP